jgi:hypothetical protein
MFARAPWLVLLCLPACGVVRDWRELRSAPMAYGECFDGLVFVASGAGFSSDASVTDRGLGIWQSRWRTRIEPVKRHPVRYRFLAEVLLDEGSDSTGWPIRFVVEQEVVNDLRRSMEPREEDWSRHGQEREKEAILGDALVRKLAPKAPARSALDKQP